MNRHALLLASFGAAAAALSRPSPALTPAEVFEKVSPSVWQVRALDAQERPFKLGTGVVIGQGQVATNCHLLAKAKFAQVRRENVSYYAKLEDADVERDLCVLSIKGFSAPAVEIADFSSVKVGNRAYLIGNPEGLSLTLSEGLISGLRPENRNIPPIQTSAATSPGGGVLFDEQGRLIGLIEAIFVGRDHVAQNLNFALPAEWIRDVPKRAKEQLAHRRETTAKANPSVTTAADNLPRVGELWKYRLRDLKYPFERVLMARVSAVNGSIVDETVGFEDGTEVTAATDTRLLRFVTRRMPGRQIVELSPYFLPAHSDNAPETFGTPIGYPLGPSNVPFNLRFDNVRKEEITTPLGTLHTVRIEVSGERGGSDFAALAGIRWDPDYVSRFRFTAWFAPNIARYVKAEHIQWDPNGDMTSDEVLELLARPDDGHG